MKISVQGYKFEVDAPLETIVSVRVEVRRDNGSKHSNNSDHADGTTISAENGQADMMDYSMMLDFRSVDEYRDDEEETEGESVEDIGVPLPKDVVNERSHPDGQFLVPKLPEELNQEIHDAAEIYERV